MAQYDGSIRINTKIDSKEASASLMTLENRIIKTADKVASLRSKMDELKKTKAPTQEYAELDKELGRLGDEYDKLAERQQRFLSTGGKEGSSAYKRMEYDLDALDRKQDEVIAKMKELEASGKAFTLGSDTDEYTRLGQQLQYAENNLDILNQRHRELSSRQENNRQSYKKLGDTAKKSFDKINRSAEKANKTAKKSGGIISMMVSRFKGLALSLLIFNQISKAFNAMISGIKEGMKNLAQYSSDTNEALSLLMSRSTYLKNALATAFSPIVEVVTPILVRFIELLGEAATKVSELFSALMGRDTFTRAVKVQQDYAKSLKDISKNTKKAAEETKKALAPFDDLRQIQFQEVKEQDNLEDSEMELTPDKMFEPAKVSEDVKKLADTFKSAIDAMKQKAKELKDIFMSGFWDGLGDYKPRLEELKSDLQKIGGYLKDIFTDADVRSAASRFVNSFVYMVGTFVGSMASIGLTIATNIVGGIESYLSRNIERIKEWLVRMFDIGTEINTIFSNFFIAFADVFSVFASQTAQDITGYIIQIFADVFGGILELTLKFVRDVLDMILTPFVENKDKIKDAIAQTLEPIKVVIQSIAETVRKAVDEIVDLYDDHINPFFMSIKDGLSELLGKLMDAYTTYIIPILDSLANKFKEVMDGPVGDAINSAINFIGKLVDALKLLWEEILAPFVGWIISNIIPVVAPIIESIGKVCLDVFGGIAELISGLFDELSGLIDFIVGVFTGDWARAWEGMQQIVDGATKTIMAILNTVASVILDTIKGIIDFIKEAINAVNNLLSGSHGDISYNSKGVSGKLPRSRMNTLSAPIIPDIAQYKIPALATGTVVPPNREFLATLGDNKREPEIVSPLSTMEQAVENVLGRLGISGGGQSDRPIYLQLDGKTFARLMNPYTEAEKTRVGIRMVNSNA